MAVYTKVERDTLETFLGDYMLGELRSFEGIKEGVENTNYRLTTSQGHFILTLYEARTKAQDLPYFLEVMSHSATRDIPCPHPIGDKSGELLKTLSGKPAAIFSLLNGNAEMEPNSTHCRKLGELLAKFHLANNDFEARRENYLSPKGWHELIEKVSGKADRIEPGLSQELRSELDFVEHRWPQHLPKGVIHADLFPDNVLWQGTELCGMIDFYFACHDMLAYDLAVCLTSWCFTADHHFSKAHASALIEGYESVRPLNHAEHDMLTILCRGAALRFLSTRMHDLFFSPAGALVVKKDPVDFLRRSRYFRNHDVLAAA